LCGEAEPAGGPACRACGGPVDDDDPGHLGHPDGWVHVRCATAAAGGEKADVRDPEGRPLDSEWEPRERPAVEAVRPIARAWGSVGAVGAPRGTRG
jgi:hypothetical protein